uniref:hypothetical protein n=1 Tax=Aeromonas sp. Ne-1 TaxID=1675689 RepID=UPI001565EB0D|nr:hypothetical protein [Aeromonas sp. Ne-1]
MKQLLIYKENGEFVIERVNDHFALSYERQDSFKRRYTTENGFVEGLRSYQPIIKEYDVIVEKELKLIVKNLFGAELLS